MPTLRNISGLGDLDIEGVGFVAAGATFDVTDAQAERLVCQVENFVPVTTKKAATAVTTEES